MANMESTIVVPGELISEKPFASSYTYVENGKTYSAVVGLLKEGKVIPLEGPYRPVEGDAVIGIVLETRMHGYNVLMKTANDGFLSSKDTMGRLEVGDIITGIVGRVDELGSVTLSQPRRLGVGRLIEVPAVKVPRIIGKSNSMITMIKEKTDCNIIVGKNGYVWIGLKGNSLLAIESIKKIVKEAHIPGLTDRIHAYLSAHETAAEPGGSGAAD